MIPYIDDVPIKGPKLRYQLPDSGYETILENPAIRQFIWEHFKNLNRILQHVKYCGGTFSGHKLYLCVPEIMVLGHICNFEGQKADPTCIDVIQKWGPCRTLTKVKAFLGTIGVCRIFIQNFAQHASPLIALTRKGVPFEFGLKHITAQEDLKMALIESPEL
jgi:hypothetical protein